MRGLAQQNVSQPEEDGLPGSTGKLPPFSQRTSNTQFSPT
jgi:hypothetical protein